MSDNLRRATFRVGQAGLNGTGITAPEKTTITNDLTALKAATYITQTASSTLSAEQALSTLSTGLVKVTTGTGVLSTAVAADLPTHTHTVTFVIPIIVDGGGAAITSGVKGDMYFPFACTITANVALADQTGTGSVNFWIDDLASYPPTSSDTNFTVALSADNANGPVSMSTSIAAGDTLRWNVPSLMTSITRFSANLIATRTI